MSAAETRRRLKEALIAAGRTEAEAEREIQAKEIEWAFRVGPREMFG